MKDDNVNTMFLIFGQYNFKGPIELDASLAKPFKDIQKHFIWPKTYEEIMTCMQIPNEDVNLADL